MSSLRLRNVPQETSSRSPWRLFFAGLIVAAVLGFSFRLYFSPQRLKAWIEGELQRQPSKIRLKFDSVAISLSRGSLPQLAIRLIGVEGRAETSCASQPGFRLSEVYIPVRITSLFAGKVAAGRVHGESLQVDLDALRDRCEQGQAVAVAIEKTAVTPTPTSSESKVRPWWTAEQLQTVQNLMAGLDFENVELIFEEGRKRVFLSSLSARSDRAPQTLSLVTHLQIPPEALYGQSLPKLAIEATVRPDAAEVKARGNLSEGALTANAIIKAAHDDVEIEARVNAVSVPLAALAQVARDAGWRPKKNVQPKFMWLNCEASISGGFKRLFKENAVTVERCDLQGDSGRLSIDQAMIGPGDKVKPFEIEIEELDVGKVLAMIGASGPKGVMTKFGSLDGRVRVAALDRIAFEGVLEDAAFLFSNHSVRAEQKASAMHLEAAYHDHKVTAAITAVDLDRGKFDGRVDASFQPKSGDGDFTVDIKDLAFNPEVLAVMIAGEMDGMSLKGQGMVRGGAIDRFTGKIDLNSLDGHSIRLLKPRVLVEYSEGTTHLTGQVPLGAIHSSSSLFHGVRPVFLGREFVDGWITLKDIGGRIDVRNREIEWSKASFAVISGGLIQFASAGRLSASGDLSGWIGVDYPKLKKLRWDLTGTTAQPVLTPASRVVEELAIRPVSNTALGLTAPTVADPGNPLIEQRSPSTALRSLGRQVFERAKAIIPIVKQSATTLKSMGESLGSAPGTVELAEPKSAD